MKHSQFSRLALAAALVLLGAGEASAQGRGRGRGRGEENHGRQVSAEEQQRRIAEEQQRQADYQRRLDAQVRDAQARSALLQQQRANAQYAAQQRYLDALRQQQAQARAQRDWSREPYITAPPTYRYRFNGAVRETNQYGADALRAAVNNGYQVGYRQGEADRSDGASSNYSRSFAYQDASYGYSGYIAQSDYNYYFRQGFRRGYSDGYGSRTQYGTVSNGNASILSSILSGILGLTSIP